MRRSGIVLLVIGLVVLVLAAIWVPVAVPSLTKLPTSLDMKLNYTGTYTGYVNQSTGASLAAPQVAPVSVARQVQAIAAKSTSADLAVLDTSAIAIGPQKQSQVLQYVLNRKTEQSVASPDAYALVPGNVVNRAGTYSLGPPKGPDQAKSYPLWNDQAGRAIPLTSQAGATQVVDGLTAQRWQDNLPATAMPAAIVTAMHLPATLAFAAFEAELTAKGINLGAALSALAPSLTAAQKSSLAAATSAPIQLHYMYATHATLLVEPTTGAPVDVVTDVQSFAVKPDLAPLAAALTPILAAHAANPAVARLAAAAGQLTSAPASPLYTISIHQTPASVANLVKTAKHNATLLTAVSLWFPIILGVIGLILIGVSLLLRHRRVRPAPVPVPASQASS